MKRQITVEILQCGTEREKEEGDTSKNVFVIGKCRSITEPTACIPQREVRTPWYVGEKERITLIARLFSLFRV